MGGVVSGSAIMIPKSTGHLHTITLTINNQCNLHCPHCYLKYSGTKDIIEDKTIDFIFLMNNCCPNSHISNSSNVLLSFPM